MFTTRQQLIEVLRRRVRNLEEDRRTPREAISSGCPALDKLLPHQGFQRGTIVEWLAAAGGGAATLALIAARQACLEGAACVVIDRQARFYPPAAAALGIDLANTFFVRPQNPADQAWALNQALGCLGVGAVLCWPEELNDRAFRRLQLAAERGGSLGLLLRPPAVRGQPTWAEVQLLVEPLPTAKDSRNRRWRIEVTRLRGASSQRSVELELNDETATLQQSRPVHLAPALAARASPHRASGA